MADISRVELFSWPSGLNEPLLLQFKRVSCTRAPKSSPSIILIVDGIQVCTAGQPRLRGIFQCVVRRCAVLLENVSPARCVGGLATSAVGTARDENT